MNLRTTSLAALTLLAVASVAGAQSAPRRPWRDVPPPTPAVVPPPPPQVVNQCQGPDCIPYDIQSQGACRMVAQAATHDPRWHAGLSTSVDERALQVDQSTGWNVVAYRIQWFNGAWSPWYVSGVNDLDWKFNAATPAAPPTLRRVWSYFFDHHFEALACRADAPAGGDVRAN